LVEIARETRLKNSYFQDDVEVEAGKDPLEFNLEALQAKYEESDAELEQRIKELAIQPSDVLPWFGHHNKTGFLLEGFALKYCPEDLEAQGVLLNGPGRDPYAKAIQSVASLARSLNSPTTSPPSVLMLWYGHRWGSDINVVGDDDVYKHMNVLQEIYPVGRAIDLLSLMHSPISNSVLICCLFSFLSVCQGCDWSSVDEVLWRGSPYECSHTPHEPHHKNTFIKNDSPQLIPFLALVNASTQPVSHHPALVNALQGECFKKR